MQYPWVDSRLKARRTLRVPAPETRKLRYAQETTLLVYMSSTVRRTANSLSYRWGEMQEDPPEFIDDLMIKLTTALVGARQSGEVSRAECLDEVLDVLAEGIYKYEHQGAEDVEEKILTRAVSEIRTYYRLRSNYYLESGSPKVDIQGFGELLNALMGPERMFPGRDTIPVILN